MINELKNHIPNIHKEGYIIILIALIATVLAFVMTNTLGTIATILSIFCVFFFRDPERVSPLGESLVISPADGIVQQIVVAHPPDELNMQKIEMKRVSIFLNIFDVHVNRVPINGLVKELVYRPGKFINASFDKASKDNERESILIEADYKKTHIAVVQIAGLIARRIVCNLHKSSHVVGGDRFGIIKFGSRVDIYLPTEAKINVLVGQRMVGGETVIADLSESSTKRDQANNQRMQVSSASSDQKVSHNEGAKMQSKKNVKVLKGD